MFRSLQLRKQPLRVTPEPGALSVAQLVGDASLPISIHAINNLPAGAARRLYRVLLPPALLARLGVQPLSWKGANREEQVRLTARAGSGAVKLSVCPEVGGGDEAVSIELADNNLNGIDLNLLLLNDPASPRFGTDRDPAGEPTLFGTVRRNMAEEQRAMQAGLAPGQIRASLGGSKQVLDHLDAFLTLLGQPAVFLEPLSYASAWVFERRGFAYVRGHKLMLDIQREFQPGGRLHQALDGSTPFRQPQQWRTVRGRAWAIQDGVLEALDTTWNNLRMVRQVGRHAGVSTFADGEY
jgi:hypothetical protein